MLPPLAFELPAFLLGLLFGSFLNVCISRLPEHRNISKPRSHCPNCGQTIRWYDNIPLLSWVLLRGRCRHCDEEISWRYPAVELALALWWAVAASHLRHAWVIDGFITVTRDADVALRLSAAVLGFSIVGFLLIGLLVMDWQTHTLPDAFTLTGTVLGFLTVCVQAMFLAPGEGDIKLNPHHSLRMSSPGSFAAKGNLFLTGPEHLVYGRLGAIVASAGLLLLVRVVYKGIRKRDGLGLGDAKLLGMIAAFLGFWPAMLALFLGLMMASFYAVTLLVRRRADALTQLPFGSFLCAGGLVAALFGTRLLGWYTSLF